MPKHTRHGCGFAGGKFNTRLHYLAGFAAYQGNPLIVVLVTVTETFFLHFAFAVGQYLVKEQEMAVAEAAVVPKWDCSNNIPKHFSCLLAWVGICWGICCDI